MSADWAVFLGAAVAVTVFVFAPSVVRALRDWFRPEPLAEYRWPYDDLDADDWWR